MKQARGPSATAAQSASKAPSKPQPAPAPEQLGRGELTTLQSSLTGGSPLPTPTRKRLESSFQTDLTDVRVHTGGAAASATDRVQAEAFASGRDIAFAPGRFAPGTASGDHLIAEEVAHVIQQRGSGGQVVQRHAMVSAPSDSAETAARAAADNVVAGKPARLTVTGLSTRGRIMRRARMGAVTPSPVVAAPANGLGTTKAGPAPVLTPVMTSTLSPAGGKLVDSAGRKDAKPGKSKESSAAKAPDEAQTAVAGDAPSAPGVMVSGSPAGAAAEGEAAAPKGQTKGADAKAKEDKREKEKAEKKDKDKKRRQGAGGARGGAGGGGGGGGTFGKIEGDRGAAAAEAAGRRLDERAEALGTNEGADARIGAAQAAAAPPPNAADAAGQQQQAGTLESADVPAGDPAAARSASRSAVTAATPGSIEDLEDFASPGGAARRRPLTDAIAGQADTQTGPVRASLSAVDSPPQGAAPPPAVPQPEPMGAPASADPALGQAVPPPVNEEALDATEFKADADAKLAEHDVDDETLNKADEGPLREIGNDKNTLNEKVDQAAGRARATETQARETARSTLAGAQSGAQASMDAERTGGQTTVSAEQDGTRTGEEQAEQTLADQINTTYQTAQTTVNEKLSSLTQDAVSSFRERQGQRLEAFASGVRSDLADLKRRRYSGARGLARRLRDWVLSINSVPEVKRLYERHRNQYISDIDGLITQIKADIDRTIEECKTALRTARETIEQLVSDNEGTLDQEAQAALANATSGFARMEQQIDDAAAAAKRALDAERERAIEAMDAELERIRAENAGLVDRLAAAISALAAALGQFMALMTRVTRMGIGAFLSAALSQAGDGIRNNLWGQLQEAFKQWLFMKLPVLQLLLSLPPNWVEMLTALATNMIGLFTENLPAMLPAIGTAAMIWLATTLAAKLIPGVGAIMAVIDAIRGAYALVQSLFQAASAFYEFVMRVADRGNGAVAFARALAFGIVAAVDAVLTFLGVDRLITRVVGAIARPFGRIIRRISGRFRAFLARRRRRRQRRRQRDRNRRDRDGGRGNANRRRTERGRARQRRRDRRRRRAQRRPSGRRRDRRRESASDRRRRRDRERQRRKQERLDRAVTALRPKITRLLNSGVSGLRLRIRLGFWRVRYRLSSLALQGNQIVAAINPRKPVIVSDKMSPGEIGAALDPVLRRAEAEYMRYRASIRSRAGQERMRRADERMRTEENPHLPPLRRDEEVSVFRGVAGQQISPSDRPGGHRSTRVTGGFPATVDPDFGAPTFFNTGSDDRAGLPGIWVQSAGSYAGGTRGSIGDHIDRVAEGATGGGVTRGLSQSRQRLLRTVEPARRQGAFASMSIGEEMAHSGLVSHREALAGESAPMAFEGATSGTAAAEQEVHRRTGNLFGHLRQAITRQDIYSKPGGAALRKLAIHVERFLAAHMRAQQQGQEVSQSAIRRLTAQLVATLKFFEGGL